MNKFEREIVLDFAMATIILKYRVENLLKEYECNGGLTNNQIIRIKHGVRVLEEREKALKKVLGIEV